MATKKKKSTAKKKAKKPIKKTSVKKRTRKQAASKHGKAVADPKTQSKAKARPVTKSKARRVNGAIGELDKVLHGIGAERADRIRERVRFVLNSFR